MRKFDGMFNVQWFGAVGDGSTDDTAAFAAAVALGLTYVPKTSSYYALTALSNANRQLLFGPGHVKVASAYTFIATAPSILPASAGPNSAINVLKRDLAPAQTSGLVGSVGKGAFYSEVKRTGGYGQYGNILSLYTISEQNEIGEFDCGITSWVTHQNLNGGQVFGAWMGANSPSSSLGHTFASGSTIGMEIDVGNRWGDPGLLTTISNNKETVGLKIAPDVIPAEDGVTASIYRLLWLGSHAVHPRPQMVGRADNSD